MCDDPDPEEVLVRTLSIPASALNPPPSWFSTCAFSSSDESDETPRSLGESPIEAVSDVWLEGSGEDDAPLEEEVASPQSSPRQPKLQFTMEEVEDHPSPRMEIITTSEDTSPSTSESSTPRKKKKKKKPRNRPSKKVRQRNPVSDGSRSPSPVSRRPRSRSRHRAQLNNQAQSHSNSGKKRKPVVIQTKSTPRRSVSPSPNRRGRPQQQKKRTASKKRKEKKVAPPSNVCWEWKQRGVCTMASRKHRKQLDHSEEWCNYYGR
jgi:hypothetical protein